MVVENGRLTKRIFIKLVSIEHGLRTIPRICIYESHLSRKDKVLNISDIIIYHMMNYDKSGNSIGLLSYSSYKEANV
jgi:hypothetical protein